MAHYADESEASIGKSGPFPPPFRSRDSSIFRCFGLFSPLWHAIVVRMKSLYFLFFLGITCLVPGPLSAQTSNLTAKDVDTESVLVLPNHHPAWASAKNDFGTDVAGVTARPPDAGPGAKFGAGRAPKKRLADQQNPASPDYIAGLRPRKWAKGSGLSDQDIEAPGTGSSRRACM